MSHTEEGAADPTADVNHIDDTQRQEAPSDGAVENAVEVELDTSDAAIPP